MLLVVFLALAWLNFAPSFQARLHAATAVDRRPRPVSAGVDDGGAEPAPARPSVPAPAPAAEGHASEADLRAGERNTIAIYRAVSPSVVSVVNRALVRGGFFGMEVFEVPRGSGSGFVWDR